MYANHAGTLPHYAINVYPLGQPLSNSVTNVATCNYTPIKVDYSISFDESIDTVLVVNVPLGLVIEPQSISSNGYSVGNTIIWDL